MAEIEIVKANQIKTGAPSLWDSRKFAELMAFSHKDAAQYCIDCGIDTEINGVNVKDMVAPVEAVVETNEIPMPSKEDLQDLLKKNNVKFSHLLGQSKLFELAKTNGLIE